MTGEALIEELSYRPDYPLRQFVDWIWVGKASSIEVQSSHYAALFTELIFNYGDYFEVSGQNIRSIATDECGQILSGLKTRPFKTKASGTYNSIGLILKPFCFGALINYMGSHQMRLVSEILHEIAANNAPSKLKMTESHLLDLFKTSLPDTDLIDFERYVSTNVLTKGSIEDFNSSISISKKSFIQKFKKFYLLTPNKYLKLKRVNAAVQRMKAGDFFNLTQVGFESGFYDQPHFTRVFKEFCGVTPREFLCNIN